MRAVLIDKSTPQFQPLPMQAPLEPPPATPLPTPSSTTETSPAWDLIANPDANFHPSFPQLGHFFFAYTLIYAAR
jgi:hypothetical protein